MKKLLFSGILILALLVGIFTNCKKDDKKNAPRVGLVTGAGTLNDGGFNQSAYQGILKAAKETELAYEVRESADAAAIEANIRYFADDGYDIIICLGYDAADACLQAAKDYTECKFLLLDYAVEPIPSNMVCNTFKIDEVTFPAGFLAAWWAWKTHPFSPEVGFVAGPEIPTIQQFTMSYSSGVEYFNNLYGKNVDVSGAFIESFNDTVTGGNYAQFLINEGAEVILACAGRTGNGALYKVKELGRTGIGVDTDQFTTLPAVGSCLMTSCMKSLDVFVHSELINISKGNFHGGQVIKSSLANSGVGLAPYHNYDVQIPDSIKAVITTIKTGIMNGTISTGWPK